MSNVKSFSTFAITNKKAKAASEFALTFIKLNKMSKLTDFSEISLLLPIHSDNGTKQTLSAKSFHEFLGFDKSNWAKWYKSNLVNNPYAIENEDYASLVLGTNANKTPNMDFEITLDFAKRLAMMAKTDRGETARLYFIECERKAMQPAKLLTVEQQLANAVILSQKILAEKDAIIAELEPEANAFKMVVSTGKHHEYTDVAINLGWSVNDLYIKLLEIGWMGKNHKPTVKAIRKGLMVSKPIYLENIKEVKEINFFTDKGREHVMLLRTSPESTPLFSSIVHGR